MADLHSLDVDELARRFFSGETVGINDLTAQYTRAELSDFLRENISQLQAIVLEMTPAQLAYKLPGTPSGPDASGDEEHFDASQILTHLASGIAFHWWGMARALGHDRPDFPKPPEGAKLTASRGRVLGAGGWTGASPQELSALLQEFADRFLAYINTLPEELESGGTTSSMGPFRDLTPHSWLCLDAVHTAMHLNQIRKMQAQPDYPR